MNSMIAVAPGRPGSGIPLLFPESLFNSLRQRLFALHSFERTVADHEQGHAPDAHIMSLAEQVLDTTRILSSRQRAPELVRIQSGLGCQLRQHLGISDLFALLEKSAHHARAILLSFSRVFREFLTLQRQARVRLR